MIRCIAVDDETPALDLLEDNIKRISFLQLVKRCKNAFEAAEVLKHEEIELMFLDIQMPGIMGTDFLRELSIRPLVIFITAYKKYAVDGFDLDVLDYLVKPVSFERFLKSVNKAQDWFSKQGKGNGAIQEEPGYLFVNSGYMAVKIDVNTITHVEGLKNYVKIHLSNSQRPILTKLTLKVAQEKLPAAKFTRVHKSFIISIDKITSIRSEFIHLGQQVIPMGKAYKEEFQKRVKKLSRLERDET